MLRDIAEIEKLRPSVPKDVGEVPTKRKRGEEFGIVKTRGVNYVVLRFESAPVWILSLQTLNITAMYS